MSNSLFVSYLLDKSISPRFTDTILIMYLLVDVLNRLDVICLREFRIINPNDNFVQGQIGELGRGFLSKVGEVASSITNGEMVVEIAYPVSLSLKTLLLGYIIREIFP